MALARQWQPGPGARRPAKQLAATLGVEIKLRFTEPHRRQRFAIMVTREAHALEALLAATRSGRLKAEPAVIISNRRDLEPIARAHRLPFVHVPWLDRARAEATVLRLLEKHEGDFVVLARFASKISLAQFRVLLTKTSIINDSSLPAPQFPRAVMPSIVLPERGCQRSVGVTAHFVTMHLDEGPIIAQGSLPVKSTMTLKDIIAAGQKLEAAVLVKAVRLHLAKRLDVC